jgi:ABC-type antimicrobial peptide transport system permease subunit
MDTHVPTIDTGRIWVPLALLQRMVGLEKEAAIIVVNRSYDQPADPAGWDFKDHDFLLKDIRDVVKTKRIGGAVIYIILLFMALLAVFDSQILAIFRRRKEIGTLMALGMVRTKVVTLFTLEGAMHGLLGIALAAVYGIPILIFSASRGIPIPGTAEEYGFAISSRLFPIYSTWLLAGTVAVVMLTVTIVSYLPSRSISQMNPTEALKGKRS